MVCLGQRQLFTGRSPGTWAASQGVSRVLGSTVCLWADGCVFCNPVGAPGFGKSWLLSPTAMQGIRLLLAAEPQSLLPFLRFSQLPCWDLLVFIPFSILPPLWKWLASPQGRSRGNKLTILACFSDGPSPNLLVAGNPGQKESQHPQRGKAVVTGSTR